VVRKSVRHIFVVFIVAALVFGGVGCAGSDGTPKDAVAVVGNEAVTKQDLHQLLERARANAKQNRRPFPKQGTPQYRRLRDQLVQYLVGRAQLAADARDRGIEISDEEIEQKRNVVVETYFGGSEKRYRERLAKEGVTDDQARADLEASLLQEELVKDVSKDVKVTNAEVRKHYNKNKRKYSTGGKTHPYAEVKEQIRKELLQARRSEASSKYLDEIARKKNVDYEAGYAPHA
jgi:SurA N-terminal domain/PPIC-type PPIASE domain